MRKRDPAFVTQFPMHRVRDTASALWPFRRRKRTVNRIDREWPAVLPLHDHHRRANAVARRVELHAARERIGGLTGLEIELVDLLIHLNLVGDTRALQRLLEDPGVTVAREAVLRDPRLTRLLLVEIGD